MSDQEQRDDTHIEQHGDGDVNVTQEAPEADTGSVEDLESETEE